MIKSRFWRRFAQRKSAVVSLFLLLVLLIIGLTAEIWTNSKPIAIGFKGGVFFPILKNQNPNDFSQDGIFVNYRALNTADIDWAIWPLGHWDAYESNLDVASFPGPPSRANWLGTDDRGRDVLARLIYGLRYSLGFAALVWLWSFTMGTILGGIMGLAGGWTDLLGQRDLEQFQRVPLLLMLLTPVRILGPHFFGLIIFVTLFSWMPVSVYVRAEVLRLRQRDFILAAQAQGQGFFAILFHHLVPNSLTSILTLSPLAIATHVYTLAALDYLGLGLPAPTPSWGELLTQAQNYFAQCWWLAVWPSSMMILVLTLLILVSEGVRFAFNPH